MSIHVEQHNATTHAASSQPVDCNPRRTPRSWLVAVGATTSFLIVGCQRPLHEARSEELHRSLVESVRREIQSFPADVPTRETTQPPEALAASLASRKDELAQLAGPTSYQDAPTPIDLDLTGDDQHQVALSLREAIVTAVRNNLDLQVQRLNPAIARTNVIASEAAFDAVFFAEGTYTKTDEPAIVPVLNNVPLGAAARVREDYVFETGIRKPLASGGTLTASTTMEQGNNQTPGFFTSPDPSRLTRLTFGINQPLLRGFGTDVNLAQIRLAQNSDRRAGQELRQSMLALARQVEVAYWDLVIAWRTLQIQQRLLERGIEVREFMMQRAELRGDVRDAQVADAIATVERRKANIIRIRRQVRATSDQLKALLNDPELTVGSEALLNPSEFMIEAPIEYNLRDVIVTAIERRPEIQVALLSLDDASINSLLADNARLPVLDFNAQLQLIGLNDDFKGAYDSTVDDSFVNFLVSAIFEQPIGNRAAEANFREARLRQSAATIAYRGAVQDVVLNVKSALRDVVTNYELIQATRTSRIAAAENLRALLVDEELRTVPTPEFLDLKFQRQEALAVAEVAELEALADYNGAVARLYEAMGIGLEMNRIEMTYVDDE